MASSNLTKATGVTGTMRTNQFADFPSTSTSNTNGGARAHPDDARPSQSSSMVQAFASTPSSWTTGPGIWGNSSSSNGFASEGSRSRENNPYPQNGGLSDIMDGKTGSGSLVASSESDSWGARPSIPWNAAGSSSPALSNAGLKDPAASPATARSTQQSAAESLRSASPYFPSPILAPGVGAQLSNFPPPKRYLDPTIGSFKTSRIVDAPPSFVLPRNFPRNQSADDNQSIDAIGNALAANETDRVSRDTRTISTPISDAPIISRLVNSPSRNAFGSQQPAFSHQPFFSPPTFHPGRTSHTGHASSLSTQSISRNFDDFSRDGLEAERLAAMRRLSLGDGNDHQQGANGLASFSQPAMEHYSSGQQGNHSQRGSAGELPGASGSNGVGAFAPEGYPQLFNPEPYYYRGPRGQTSPSASEYYRSMQNPYYSGSGTPQAGTEYYRAPSRDSQSGRNGHGHHNVHPAILDRKLSLLQHEQQAYPSHNANAQVVLGNSHQYRYDHSPHNGRLNQMIPFPFMIPSPLHTTGPSRYSRGEEGYRSPLMEEFRSNIKSNKRYELKDLYNHIVEFSGDQNGSRFIQEKLESANSDEKAHVFREIRPNALQLMTDIFGNYVIQKFFEHGDQVQKKILFEQMRGHILNLSVQTYGCRVVQKALEHILADQQIILVRELENNVLKCVKDQHGNHVIQKAIERVPREHIDFIFKAFPRQIFNLATHTFGCRVIQRMLEHRDPFTDALLIQELHGCAAALIYDQYGNYVTQHLIVHGSNDDRVKIMKLITGNFLRFSKHKYASNVVEKCIQYGSTDQRHQIFALMTTANPDGYTPLHYLMKDQFGNYVIQKLLSLLEGDDHDQLVELIKPQIVHLKKHSFAKQISAIEKVVFHPKSTSQPTSPPTPLSAVTTPEEMQGEIPSDTPTVLPTSNSVASPDPLLP
ncbi:MAG: mRNA binding protein puf3 [Trizodia sp. TS-e1964]|nr:MAG: mRNA binding protein puf3 [Trizodia sp. TS-e1964]